MGSRHSHYNLIVASVLVLVSHNMLQGSEPWRSEPEEVVTWVLGLVLTASLTQVTKRLCVV